MTELIDIIINAVDDATATFEGVEIAGVERL